METQWETAHLREGQVESQHSRARVQKTKQEAANADGLWAAGMWEVCLPSPGPLDFWASSYQHGKPRAAWRPLSLIFTSESHRKISVV